MVKIGVVVGLLALTVGGLSVAQQGGGRPWGGGAGISIRTKPSR